MMTIYSEIQEKPISNAQRLDKSTEVYNEVEINQLEVKKLIDKDFSCIKSIDWYNTPKEQKHTL